MKQKSFELSVVICDWCLRNLTSGSMELCRGKVFCTMFTRDATRILYELQSKWICLLRQHNIYWYSTCRVTNSWVIYKTISISMFVRSSFSFLSVWRLAMNFAGLQLYRMKTGPLFQYVNKEHVGDCSYLLNCKVLLHVFSFTVMLCQINVYLIKY